MFFKIVFKLKNIIFLKNDSRKSFIYIYLSSQTVLILKVIKNRF